LCLSDWQRKNVRQGTGEAFRIGELEIDAPAMRFIGSPHDWIAATVFARKARRAQLTTSEIGRQALSYRRVRRILRKVPPHRRYGYVVSPTA